MKNYVIINGVNSNTITGLMINELPPITKPSMRVLTEEIDGRDGDITTNLGYSAYDKTITIGLFGTGYDIDDIVAFFNGEGTIVFSNEADKYYNYKIINQIDYVALQKFKSASVTFHCQPFKYPLEETPIEIDYDYIEEQDVESATLNTAKATMQVNLLGNTSQTGTPTPSSPIPVNVVSGDNTIVSTGKNLLPVTANTTTVNGITFTINEDKTITINGTATAKASIILNETHKTMPPGTYTLSTGNSDSSLNFSLGMQLGSSYPNSKTSVTITINENTTFFKWYIDVFSGAIMNNVIIKPMLEKGSTATTYEPYTSTSYPIHLGTYELCKIGNYQDGFFKAINGNSIYDNLDSATKESLTYGEWYLEKKIGKYTFTGNENMSLQNNGKRIFIRSTGIGNNIPEPLHTPNVNIKYGMYSNKLVEVTAGQTWGGTQGISYDYDSNVNLGNFDISINGISTIADYRTAIAGIILYYILQTPTYTQITGTLKDELEALQKAQSYKGTTNINQINNDLPFKMNLKAIEDGSNEGIVNNIGNTYAKPIIELEGTGEINIYLNDVQMLKATLTDKMTIDIAKMEAYNPDTSVLLNRQLIGDISKFLLPSGESTIRIDGNLTKATISNYTRWL